MKISPGSWCWIAAVLSGLLGCDDSRTDSGAATDSGACKLPDGDRYSEIGNHPLPILDGPLVSLCTLVRADSIDSAGLYEVRGLIGRRERSAGATGTDEPDEEAVTYVELALVDDWMRARECAIARLPGGPYPDGEAKGWQVALAVGERVGVFLARPNQWNPNHGFPFFNAKGVFKPGPGGGWTNGELFAEHEVSEAELAQRRAAWKPAPKPTRGWYKLYVDHVQQAHLGADLDVLVGGSGAEVSRDRH